MKENQRPASNWFTPRSSRLLREKQEGKRSAGGGRPQRAHASGEPAGIWPHRATNAGGTPTGRVEYKSVVRHLTDSMQIHREDKLRLRSRTINTNISSYLMVHDFGEKVLCDAINFKHKTFILNSLSNEFLGENDCQTKHSKSWKEQRRRESD